MSDDEAVDKDEEFGKTIDAVEIDFFAFMTGQKDVEEFIEFFLGAFDAEEAKAAKKALELKFYMFYLGGYMKGRQEILEAFEKSLKGEDQKDE